jgi:DNA-binding CsgD family transcriptional regulator
MDAVPSIGAVIEPEARTTSALSALSPRETEVLAMTASGQTNAQVAANLAVTVHAVKFHLASVYRKLGVSNRTEAAVTYLAATQRGGS